MAALADLEQRKSNDLIDAPDDEAPDPDRRDYVPMHGPNHACRICGAPTEPRYRFGGHTPTAPLRLEPGLLQAASHGTYRIILDDGVYETQMRLSDR